MELFAAITGLIFGLIIPLISIALFIVWVECGNRGKGEGERNDIMRML